MIRSFLFLLVSVIFPLVIVVVIWTILKKALHYKLNVSFQSIRVWSLSLHEWSWCSSFLLCTWVWSACSYQPEEENRAVWFEAGLKTSVSSIWHHESVTHSSGSDFSSFELPRFSSVPPSNCENSQTSLSSSSSSFGLHRVFQSVKASVLLIDSTTNAKQCFHFFFVLFIMWIKCLVYDYPVTLTTTCLIINHLDVFT